MTLIFIITWLLIGAAGFIYWVTKDHDITLEPAIILALFVGSFGGPFSWFAGWAIHGGDFDEKEPKVLIKKRVKP